ncbi:MAG TPA: NAD(P)H-dependent oxidoreductase [Candidatus Sulfotelmatobacter sp.]|nr:NAD(P)H-dependent oxidoreductase [Candidatus Sulfotelmatobacter sp.]
MTTISIIVGSTREGRFSEKVAQWTQAQLAGRERVQSKLLDLRDFDLPFFDQAAPPAMPGRPPYAHPIVKKWTAEIASSDGFIFVTPEYNHSMPAVLKNAIDWVYPEWNRKAAAFVSYGGVGGARAVEQLRLIAVELQLAPMRSAIHLPISTLMAHFQGGDVDAELAKSQSQADPMVDGLLWWSNALKAARNANP